jgi:chromosome segregation ATPase
VKLTPRRSAGLAALALLTSLGGAALATRSGSDRDRAEGALAALASQSAHARLAREPMAAARRALARSDEARAAGDTRHAPELDALAREHAELGTDLVRAALAEQKLGDVQKELTAVETQLTRARSLLEETLARRGRARAKLDQLEARKKAAPEQSPAAKPAPKAAPGKSGGGK